MRNAIASNGLASWSSLHRRKAAGQPLSIPLRQRWDYRVGSYGSYGSYGSTDGAGWQGHVVHDQTPMLT